VIDVIEALGSLLAGTALYWILRWWEKRREHYSEWRRS
jgi:hypothetical protein